MTAAAAITRRIAEPAPGGVAGIIGPRLGGVLYDKYHNYEAAFYTAAILAAIAFLCEFLVKQPSVASVPTRRPAGGAAV